MCRMPKVGQPGPDVGGAITPGGLGRARGLGLAYVLVLGGAGLVSLLLTVALPAALVWLLLRPPSRPGTMTEWSGAASRAGSTRS